MQLKVGAVTEGKVTGITKFGAFVEIEKGVTGLVHISEISQSFVVDISKVLKCGETVKVKILSTENNKLSLSIKQAEQEQNEENKTQVKNLNFKQFKKEQKEEKSSNNSALSFEDMLAKFKKNSEEKISDIRKNLENKRSSYSKRRWKLTHQTRWAFLTNL